MNKTAEQLFEYLKNILYCPQQAELDIEALPEDFRRLGEGIRFVGECIREESAFMQALAKGDLSMEPPDGGNVLASPAKALQASLRHLQWQTCQIAKGDYSQRVDFMGEFSEAFNMMTEQLAERTAWLLEEQKVVARQNEDLKRNLDLLLSLANYTHNMFFILTVKDKEKIFTNQTARWLEKTNPEEAEVLWEHLRAYEKAEWGTTNNWEIEVDDADSKEKLYYSVESYDILWKEKPAIVHLVNDDTNRKKQEQLVYSLAYVDPLTGVNNRRYALNQMALWISEGTPFILTFIDIDYLKYCNDTYGHDKGDAYIISTSKALSTMRCDLCRMGGDEFLLLALSTDKDMHDDKLTHLREVFSDEGTEAEPWPKSFSFATTVVPAFPKEPLSEYIRQTDRKMHEYKLANKKPLKDFAYRDSRV